MPATVTDPSIARGRLVEQQGDVLVLSVPGTDYLLYLVSPPLPEWVVGRRVAGRIYARAKRVDVVRVGGRYIEPVYGRPRRLQGRVVAIDAEANAIAVHCACPIICTLTAPGQSAEQFTLGQLVSFDVERGARFEWIAQDEPVEEATPEALDEPGDVVPAGHLPTEGSQAPTHLRTPTKERDHGALTDDRDVTGREKPAADFPISG